MTLLLRGESGRTARLRSPLLASFVRAGGGGGPALPAYYVFRDQFASGLDAAWTDHGGNYDDTDGRLGATASPGNWVEPLVHTDGIARATGRALAAWVLVSDRAGDFTVGWKDDADAADTRAVGHAWVSEGGALQVSTPGAKQTIVSTGDPFEIRPMEYLYACVLNDRGSVHLLRPFDTGDASPALSSLFPLPQLAADEAWAIWVERTDTDVLLHPAINYNGAQGGPFVDDVRAVDVAAWSAADSMFTLADRFDRADSASDPGPLWTPSHAGAAGITGQKLYFTATGRSVRNDDVGFADGVWTFTINLGANAANKFVVQLRRASSGNAILLTNVFGASIHLISQTGGVNTTIANTGFTWNAATDYRFVVIASGNKYKVFVNGADALSGVATDAGSTHLTATGFVFELSSGTAGTTQMTVDDVAALPLVVTLPEEILHGLVPQPNTVGPADVSKDFTGANGTSLATYDANFAIRAGAATIQSNAAVLTGDTADGDIVTYAYGSDDYEVAATFTPAAAFDELLAGSVVRYADANNYTYVRLFRQIGQSTDEIEVNDFVAGVGQGIRKVQFAPYWTAGTPIDLRVQVLGDLMRVYLDGQPVLSHVIPNATGDPGLIVFGATDDGTTIDAFTIKAVS